MHPNDYGRRFTQLHGLALGQLGVVVGVHQGAVLGQLHRAAHFLNIRHPFRENDINTILFWHEDLHFSAELIVYLVEYCVSKGHTNLRYLNKVALAWHEKKITSVEQAKSEAAVRSKAYSLVHLRIMAVSESIRFLPVMPKAFMTA